MAEQERRNSWPILVIGGLVAFVVVMTPIFLKFHETFTNISPQSMYESEINELQKQVQIQLNSAKNPNLSNEKIEILIHNASLASIQLSEARFYIENENLVDGHNRLMSAKNRLNENKKILKRESLQ